jgi:small subunit ribosomal protein S16
MVAIRLKRLGRTHHPYYRIAAVDSRRPRDSRVLEELGSYDPMQPQQDKQVTINADRVKYWLGVGAQPSDTVRRLLVKNGITVG